MAKREGRTVSRAELAEFMAVDLTTIDAWVRRGCPLKRRGGGGRPHEFDSAAVIEWIRETAKPAPSDSTAVSLDEARKRKTIAEAELAELELGQARGELATIDATAEVLEAILSTVRLRLLGLPAKVAARLAPIRTPAACRRLLEDEFAEVLEELSTGDELASRVVDRDVERRARSGRVSSRPPSAPPTA